MVTLTRIARWTGAAYLALAIAGMAGFLLVRPLLHVAGDPEATLVNLTQHSSLAYLGLTLELLIVLAQAVAAVGFYALFRGDRPVAAYAVATFGMANATTILASAAMLATALGVAGDGVAPAADPAATVALLYAISDGFWSVGGVFFGLWLIPMGWFMISTSRMPRVLGWILVIGGVGYVVSALLGANPEVPGIMLDALAFPATVAELGTIGYLLIRGIRSARPQEALGSPSSAETRLVERVSIG